MSITAISRVPAGHVFTGRHACVVAGCRVPLQQKPSSLGGSIPGSLPAPGERGVLGRWAQPFVNCGRFVLRLAAGARSIPCVLI